MYTLEQLKTYGFSDEVIARLQAKSDETGIPLEIVVMRCFALWFERQDRKYAMISNQGFLLQRLIDHNYQLKSKVETMLKQTNTQSQTIQNLKKQKKELKESNKSLLKSNQFLKKQTDQNPRLLDFDQSELLSFGQSIWNAISAKNRTLLQQLGLDLKECTDEAINLAEEGFAELEDEIERLADELKVAYDFMKIVREDSPRKYGTWLQRTRIFHRG